MRLELTLSVGNERGKEVGLVLRIEAVKHIMEFDGAGWGSTLGPIDVVFEKPRAGFVLAIQ